jgi:nucleotide-binding universal stress UspA family protein
VPVLNVGVIFVAPIQSNMISLDTQKILVPTDFSVVSLRALDPAGFLAKQRNGEIYLLHVKRNKRIDDAVAAERAEVLAGMLRSQFGIKVNVIITAGNCRTEIVKTAEKIGADMIMMGTEGSDSESSFFFGANALRVISRSDIPVISVRADYGTVKFRKILLPLSLSVHSRQKVNAAVWLASTLGAELHVLGLLGTDELCDKFKIEQIIRQVRQFSADKVPHVHSYILKTDVPAKKTLIWAKRLNADLIVTMTDENDGKEGVGDWTFDEHLVNESPVPVLSIPPEVHEENIVLAAIPG